jgi:hypothetical protein
MMMPNATGIKKDDIQNITLAKFDVFTGSPRRYAVDVSHPLVPRDSS